MSQSRKFCLVGPELTVPTEERIAFWNDKETGKYEKMIADHGAPGWKLKCRGLLVLALICATRNSTPIVMSIASLYPMHRHGKEGVERRKNSTTHFSIQGLDPFGACTKKKKKE